MTYLSVISLKKIKEKISNWQQITGKVIGHQNQAINFSKIGSTFATKFDYLCPNAKEIRTSVNQTSFAWKMYNIDAPINIIISQNGKKIEVNDFSSQFLGVLVCSFITIACYYALISFTFGLAST